MQQQYSRKQYQHIPQIHDRNSVNIASHNIAPYQIISQFDFEYIGINTYRQMLDYPFYDRKITVELMSQGIQILDDQIFLFVADLQPWNIQWQVFKHPSEIDKFITLLDPQIQSMKKISKRKSKTGEYIIQMHQQLKKIKTQDQVISQALKQVGKKQKGRIKSTKWQQRHMKLVQQFVKTLCNHPYMRKSVVVLTFIHHCMPTHLWNIKVYQQVPIFNDPTIFTKLFINENSIKQYLTVTGDGIILSSKNPIQTKIDQMVPFTNQFSFKSQIQLDGDLYFKISSCIHENITVNFKKDYVGGLNFHIGTKRALIDSKNHQKNRFDSFSGPRKNCWVQLYSDGEHYFSDVYDCLIQAKKQVLITDWWLTPYINLKREKIQGQNMEEKLKNLNQKYMLGKVLANIANKGIKIYIILFREPLNLLSTDSYQCQLYLEGFSPNIRVRRHPITPQLWSHHQKCIIIDQKIGFMGGLDLCYGRWDTNRHHLKNYNNYWAGGDYVNQRIKSYTPGTTKERKSPIDQETSPRMPWHDIAVQLRGDAVIDLARHFVQYWYFVDAQRIKDPYNHVRNFSRRVDRAFNHSNNQQIKKSTGICSNIFNDFSQFRTNFRMFVTGTQNRLQELLIQARQGKVRGQMQLQLCRSSSPWSIGARKYQQSIHYAYKTLITQSQHLIYIENQFFMGSNNDIVHQLAQRIYRAYLKKQNFKIVVVMPLLPGFQGQASDKANRPLRVQIHNQFQSINRGQNSIHQRLKRKISDPNFNINDYIFFFGLRGHTKINNTPVTQIIYVHSKLMIVDDKRAIIGSANINDRSLCGNRDSQLALVIQQDNGQIQGPIARRKQIFDLRARLFNEHFGLTFQEAKNSNNPQIWQKMINNAKKNTLIYRAIFGCYPDDTITVSEQIQQRKNEANLLLYDQFAPRIFANAVQFPLHFMEDQDLSFQFMDKQELVMGIDAFL